MSVPPSTPIIVGVGEVTNRSRRVEDAREPLDLMLEAIRSAIHDAGAQEATISTMIDSIAVVPPWTWPYEDLPRLIASKMGINPPSLQCGIHGGNQPALLCDAVARQAAAGESRVGIITGGEALASLMACKKAGVYPAGWTSPDPSKSFLDVSNLDILGRNVGTRHGMGLPVQVYPFYENALRHERNQSHKENMEESQEMYSEFDRIACSHKYSWRSGERSRTPQEIGTPTERNRMICTPYTLLMNAFNTVNLAAAAVVTTVEHAEALGIPREKWVYILGGAGARERDNFWERPCFHRSPALEQAIDTAISRSGLSKDDIGCYDFYSCFPIVPKLACRHLGIDTVAPSKPISLLGGLTSFGGAGNNYSMHAIAEMARKIREGTYQTGMILANGGVLTYQHVLCMSSIPRKTEPAYPLNEVQPGLAEGLEAPPFDEHAEGEAYIETYTVEFNRHGKPSKALIIGVLARDGHRFLANHADEVTLRRLCDTYFEPVGARGTVKTLDDGRNVLKIAMSGRL